MKSKKGCWTILYLAILGLVVVFVLMLQAGFFRWIFNSDLPAWLKYFILS